MASCVSFLAFFGIGFDNELLKKVGRVRFVITVTKMSNKPRWSVEETNTKYALTSLCMTWDSDPTLLTRAPREGQCPSNT